MPPAAGGARPHAGRATRALIDLDALTGNVRALVSALSPGVHLMAVVKADGYGHGAVDVGRAALAAGASALAVATVGEGEVLRRAGLTAPILVLSAIDLGEAGTALRLGLELSVGTEELYEAVAVAAAESRQPGPAAIHVKVDTGMRRYGAGPELAAALAARTAENPSLRLAGISTHFAAADEADEAATERQRAVFERVLAEIAARGVRPGVVHAANSAAVLRGRGYDYGMVRAGIALYGLPPSPERSLQPGMRPVMALRSRVTRVIELEPGDAVGYGRTYIAAGRERVAVVPIGYADGYRRSLSDGGWMGLGGGRAPVVGRVSMDQTVVRVPKGHDIRIGDEVAVFGAGDDGAPTATELAAMLGTIPYEVVTGVAARVPRIFGGAGWGGRG